MSIPKIVAYLSGGTDALRLLCDVQGDACAGREVGDAGEELARHAFARKGFKRETTEVRDYGTNPRFPDAGAYHRPWNDHKFENQRRALSR